MARITTAKPARSSPAKPGGRVGGPHAPPGSAAEAPVVSGILALQRTAGNAAVGRVLARTPVKTPPAKGERWYRGQATGVPRTTPGKVVHDLADGVYYSTSAAAAQSYGDLRATDNPGSTSTTGGLTIDRKSLGRVLDLPRDPRWATFLRSAPPAKSMGATWREYMSRTTEYYNAGFRTFLAQHNIRYTMIGDHVSALSDYDAVIAEDLIRHPNTQQMVIMNPKIVGRVDAMTRSVHVVTTKREPTPVAVGAGAGGGRLPDAPQLHVDQHGRVRLYRVVTNAELQSIVRHGDFNFAPSGGGKYFSFNRTDALKLAAKSPGGASTYTLVVVTVPRAVLPDRTDQAHQVSQPHLPARPGPASMIQGEVIIQVDRGGAGWTLHVDDDALMAMNKVMTQPEIVSSPSTPTVGSKGGAGGGPPPAKPPDEPAKYPRVKPAQAPSVKPIPTTTGTSAGRGAPPVPIEVPAPATRMSERKGAITGAATMLLGAQLSSVRGAEQKKAVKKLEELSPRIEQYRDKGFWVTVTIEVEVPDQVDIAAIWAGVGDPSQVVYFKDMWIAYAGPPVKEPEPVPQSAGPHHREPARIRQNEAVDEPRRKEWYLNHPRRGFHFVTRDLYLPPHKQDTPRAGTLKALIFRPAKVQSNEPETDFDNVGENRIIYIDAKDGFQMWNTYSNRGYRRTNPPADAGDRLVPSRLKLENDAKDGRHTVDSTLEWRLSEDGKSYEIDEIAIFTNLEAVPVRTHAARVRWVQA